MDELQALVQRPLPGPSRLQAQPWVAVPVDHGRSEDAQWQPLGIPAGAQGLSVGIQDAVNLGWNLGAAVQGRAPEGLLDSYHDECHPVGAQVLRNTQAQTLLYLTGDGMEPLRTVLRELVRHRVVANQLAGRVSGLDIQYDMGISGIR